MDCRVSVLLATMYPVDWRDSFLSATGTLWTGGTQYVQPLGTL